MAITIRLASSQRDLQRIYRFRYEVYVEEMQRPQQYADASSKTIIEPFDESGHNFLAEDADGGILGAARINFGHQTCFAPYRELYALHLLDAVPSRCISITTKLMVATSHRRGTLGIRILKELYRFGLSQGIIADFMDCNQHLEAVFEKLGYRRHRSRVIHPEYGDVQPMVFLATDIDHLDAIRSPFASICRNDWNHLTVKRRLADAISSYHK